MPPSSEKNSRKIEYPYLPEDREIKFVPVDDKFMQEAKKMADEQTGCSWWPTGAVLVKDGQIIGRGANFGQFQPVCPRFKEQCPTGEGYHLCQDPCQQVAHAEITTINNALENHQETQGADLYLYGHWWCCKPCWDHIQQHGIANVFLIENADQIFDRVPRQKLMEEIQHRIQAGGTITHKDIVWKI